MPIQVSGVLHETYHTLMLSVASKYPQGRTIKNDDMKSNMPSYRYHCCSSDIQIIPTTCSGIRAWQIVCLDARNNNPEVSAIVFVNPTRQLRACILRLYIIPAIRHQYSSLFHTDSPLFRVSFSGRYMFYTNG